MRTALITVVALAAGVAFASSASAQRPEPGSGPVAAACQDDILKLCPGVEHGRGAVRACLETNKAKVSQACVSALESTGGGPRR